MNKSTKQKNSKHKNKKRQAKRQHSKNQRKQQREHSTQAQPNEQPNEQQTQPTTDLNLELDLDSHALAAAAERRATLMAHHKRNQWNQQVRAGKMAGARVEKRFNRGG